MVALEEYKYSILLLVVVWCTLSISMCNALIGAVLFLPSFFVPSSIAQYHNATFTPVKLQISRLRASQSYSSAENNSQPAHSVSSADCRSVCHIPCLVDLSHHPIVSIIAARFPFPIELGHGMPLQLCEGTICAQISSVTVVPWGYQLDSQSGVLPRLLLGLSTGISVPADLLRIVSKTICRRLDGIIRLGSLPPPP